MTDDDPRITLADSLLPIACELVASVRDYGPEVVADVLARVPDGRHDALAVVLAAMVDPDARPKQLLAWTELGPPPSREFVPTLYRNARNAPRESLGRWAERRAEVGRLSALDVPVPQIAERLGITERAVVRHRAALRRTVEEAAS